MPKWPLRAYGAWASGGRSCRRAERPIEDLKIDIAVKVIPSSAQKIAIMHAKQIGATAGALKGSRSFYYLTPAFEHLT
jgi:hypothetical protein